MEMTIRVVCNTEELSLDRYHCIHVRWITDILPVRYCKHVKNQSCILRGPNVIRQYRCWPEYMTRLNYWLTVSEGHLNVSLRQKIDEAAATQCILTMGGRMDPKHRMRARIICRFAHHKLLRFLAFHPVPQKHKRYRLLPTFPIKYGSMYF